jgi:hypothetical protein
MEELLSIAQNLAIASLGIFVLLVYVTYIAWQNKRTAQQALDEIKSLRTFLDTMRLPGIYIIGNLVTGAEYLGSTKKNFWARWGQHVALLNFGKHENARLQADWLTYGANAFRFQIVHWIDDPDQIEALPEIEKQLLLDRAQKLPPILNYNIAHSRVYGVPSAPDAEPITPVFESPRSQRMHRPRQRKIRTQTSSNGYSLSDMGLTPEEIAALGLGD